MTSAATVAGLTDQSTGRWVVKSETSAYVLDLDRMTGIRLPGEGVDPTNDEVMVSHLRKDGSEFSIVKMVTCEVGKPMVMFARGLSDEPGVDTIRRTTFVQSIVSIS